MLAILIALGQGCATTGGTHSDFLGAGLEFKPAADGSGAMVYVEPGLTTARVDAYHDFIIDPVALWYSEASSFKGIFPDEMKAMADYFRRTAVHALGDRYPIVDQAGPKVMRIRAAFTGLKRVQPLHLYEFTPVGLAFTAAKDLSDADAITREKVLQKNSYIIEATVEVGFYVSVSNELLGAFRQTRRARPDGQGGKQGATWGQTKEVLDAWAQALRQHLDRAHEVAALRPWAGVSPDHQ
jgi:hypothetical protein